MTDLKVECFYFDDDEHLVPIVDSSDLTWISCLCFHFRHAACSVSITDDQTAQEWADLVTKCRNREIYHSPIDEFDDTSFSLMGETFEFTIRSGGHVCSYNLPTADVISSFQEIAMIRLRCIENNTPSSP